MGTVAPKGILDISSIDTGLVIPRVTKIEDVTDGDGNMAVNGTVVYDISRDKTCFRIDEKWVCLGTDSSGNPSIDPVSICSDITYIKTNVTQSNDYFGTRDFALSIDGSILAIGNPNEDSAATGINGNASDNSAANSGAVYIFVKSGGVWQQEAYIKASNTEAGDLFGYGVSLNDAGNVLVVGAPGEDSGATGFNGNQNDNSVSYSGAVYIFERTSGIWSQQGYLKPDFVNANSSGFGNYFGNRLDLNSDGTVLGVSGHNDDSEATGVNGDPSGFGARDSGAAYVFYKSGSSWLQEAYIKANIVGFGDAFGVAIQMNNTGDRLVIGANEEDSNASGINGDQNNNGLNQSGAIYIFDKSSGNWMQEAFIKASNPSSGDLFGTYIAINNDLTLLAVGVPQEASNATGINGDGSDNSIGFSGACYIFRKNGSVWTEEAYIKASYPRAGAFGVAVAINKNGDKLAIGSNWDSSDATCFNGDQENTNSSVSGAVFVYKYAGSTWSQDMYIKAANADSGDYFGEGLGMSGDGSVIAIGAPREDSNATGVGGDQSNNSTVQSGAVYIME
jgi:hypothetical protein